MIDYPPPQHPGAADERPPGASDVRRCATPACVRRADAGDTVILVRRFRGSLRIAGPANRFLRVRGAATIDRIVIRNATGVSLRGLTVREGVLVRDARDAVLRDLDVRGGIRLLRAQGGTIARTTATGPAAALSIEATPEQVRPRRTMLRRVTLRDSPVGLRLAAARHVTATGLGFAGNGADTQADAASSDYFGI